MSKWWKIEDENPNEMQELFPSRVNGCLSAVLSIIGFIFGLIIFLGILFGAQWLAWLLSEPTEAQACELPKAGFSVYLKELAESGKKLYTEDDLNLLSAVMELENGCDTEYVRLLTGSVVLNRIKAGWANNIHDVIYQGYKDSNFPQQYATWTIEHLDTVKVQPRTRELAWQLLVFGVNCPDNVIYQGRHKNGSGVFYISELEEVFCYE